MNATPLVMVLMGLYFTASASILTGPILGRLQQAQIQFLNHIAQIQK